MKETVQVTFTRSEALVLFEWLASLDTRAEPLQIDAAEEQVLWRLEGQLESTLTEILSPDYQERLSAAKRDVLHCDE